MHVEDLNNVRTAPAIQAKKKTSGGKWMKH